MIRVEGQFVAEINGDDIKTDDLVMLAIYETTGLGLPTFTLRFQTKDPELIKKYTDPACKLTIGLGKDEIQFKADYSVFNKHVMNSQGADNFMVHLTGVASSLTYLTKQQSKSYRDKKSSEVWTEVMDRNGLKSEVETTNDKMLWLQTGVTDRLFMRDVTQHGFYGSLDPLLFCIRRDLKSIYKPLSKLKTKKGIIGNMESADVISNDFAIKNLGGAMSAIGGKDRTIPYFDMEKGQYKTNVGSVTPQISSSAGLSEDYTKIQEVVKLNKNVHSHWWDSYSQNIQLLTSLSSTRLTVRLHEYHDIFALDYYEVLNQSQQGGEPMTPVNGMWIVTGVTTMIQQHDFVQYIMLSRETLL